MIICERKLNSDQKGTSVLWATKQKARELLFLWAMNGKIFLRRNTESDSIIVYCENDISKQGLFYNNSELDGIKKYRLLFRF